MTQGNLPRVRPRVRLRYTCPRPAGERTGQPRYRVSLQYFVHGNRPCHGRHRPVTIHARETEADGKSCNVCHFPEAFALPDMEINEIFKPKPRPKTQEASGLTCASCHLTPKGKIRGPYNLRAPHESAPDVRMKTSVMCAYCHSLGPRTVGQQTQTFYEWREDFWKRGRGSQNCQDCHMPRTVRSLAEDYDVPDRGTAKIEFQVINIGAGHSVPTGSNRRAGSTLRWRRGTRRARL